MSLICINLEFSQYFMFLLKISYANLLWAIPSQCNQSKWSEPILQLMKSFFRFFLKISNNLKCLKFIFFLSGPPKQGKGYNFFRFIVAPPLFRVWGFNKDEGVTFYRQIISKICKCVFYLQKVFLNICY